MIISIDVFFVKALCEVDREDDPMPLPLVDLEFRVIRLVAPATLAKASVVAPPKNVTIPLTVHVQKGCPAVATPGEIDVVNNGILVDLFTSTVWRDAVIHEIAKFAFAPTWPTFITVVLFPSMFGMPKSPVEPNSVALAVAPFSPSRILQRIADSGLEAAAEIPVAGDLNLVAGVHTEIPFARDGGAF